MRICSPKTEFLGRCAAAGLMLFLAGCQSGDNAGSVLGLGPGAERQADPTDDRISAEEVRGYCPRVQLPGTQAVLNRYEGNGEGDPAKLRQQISVSDVTRSCSFAGGQMGITVALAGRIVPGPAGEAGGTVTVPIRIEVVEASGQVLYSQIHQHPVQTAAGGGATQFIFSDPAIVIPQPTAMNVRIFAGLDVPPPKEMPL